MEVFGGGSLWRWKSLEVRKAASKIFFPLQTRTLRAAGVNLRSVSDKFKYKYINTNPKIHNLKNTMVPWFPFSAFVCRSPFVVIICRQADTICGTFVQHKSGLKIFVLFVFTFRDKLWQKCRKFGFSRQKRRFLGFSRQKCYNLGFLQGKCGF